jgi:hypothetical protein
MQAIPDVPDVRGLIEYERARSRLPVTLITSRWRSGPIDGAREDDHRQSPVSEAPHA